MGESNKSNKRDKSDKGYHRLIVWQKAHEFVMLIYVKTREFPQAELYGLTSQLRRAAVSVAANIIEGHAKTSKKEFLRYLGISKGSLAECEYYLELATQLRFLNKEDYELLENARGKVGYLLYQFIKHLRN